MKNYRSKATVRVLLNLLSDPVALVDEKGNFLLVNDAFQEVTGLNGNELVGTPILKLNIVSPESKATLLENLKNRLQGAPVETYEVCFTAKAGEIRWVEVTGKIISYDGKPASLVVFHDVTDRKKKTDEQIRFSEEKYKNLFENAPDVIVTLDLSGKITSVNKAIMQHGFKENEIVGNSVFKLVPIEFNQQMLADLKNIAAGKPSQGETEIITPKGKRNAEYSSNPIWLNGKVVGYQTTIRDITERKETQESLEKEQKELNRIIDSSPIIIFYKDKDGKFIRVSQAFAESLKIPKEEFIGKTVFDLYSAEIARGMTNDDLEVLKSGCPKLGIIEQYESASGMRWVQTDKVPILDKNGISAGLIGFAQDITDRKKTEQILKADEEKFRNLAENSPNMIFIYQKGKVVYANKEAEKAMGYTKEEYYSSEFNFLDLITPENRALAVTNFAKHTKGEDTTPYEYGLMTKDGRRIDSLLTVKIITFNGEPAILGIVTDITQRKRVQNILKESEEKFRAITNSVRDAIIMVDNRAKVASWNPAAEKTFGYSKKKAIGKNIHELIVPKTMCLESREYIRIGVKRFANTGSGDFTNGNVELIGRKKDGAEFPVKLSITPIKLRGKWSAVGVVKDITERKQAEQELEEAGKRYHTLFNEAPLGVLVIDPQTGKAVEFNDVAHLQLGYSREEFSKLCISDFEAKEEAAETNAHIAKMLRQGGDEFETEHRTKYGEIRNVLVNTKAVELAGKTFLYCIFHDITEIRKVQEALMKSETQYRQLVNVAQEGIWAFDSNYCTVFVNPRTAEMLGYAESEMVGKSIFDFLDKRVVEEPKQFLGLFKQRAKENFEYEFLRKDRSRVCTSITASALKDDKGQSVGTLALVVDITERKKKELELEEERNKFEALAQSVGAGFAVVNKDYHVLWANKFIKNYKGGVEGKLCYATLNDLDHVCPDCGVKKVFENGANSDAHEYSSIDIKGNPYWVELIATPIKDGDGNVVSAAEIAVDITEKKRLQSKLAEYSHKLERLVEERTKQLKETQAQLVKSERLAAIGELAGMVGHDLRNPLTGIKNAVYFLKKKGATISESQAKEMFEIIDKGIDHSDKIINDLLEYAREMHLELTKYEAHALVDEAIRTIKVPDQIQILNHVQEETWVWVNADKMMRVFINLIKNAIDAIPEKGKLEISSCQTKDSVEIAFADTGTGIPEETLKKIFTPLFTTKAQGMGFGLAICKRIIEAHGGTITVETEVNKGTTFTVTLPFKPKVDVGGEKTWVNMPESLLLTTTKTLETQ
jgi:PAS domain S-box-containing protein